MEFPITLDRALSTPVYEQLARAMSDAIMRGRLRPGDALPSTRALADMLGLSRPTAARAYEILKEQGFLDAVVGAGTYVRDAVERGTARSSEPVSSDALCREKRAVRLSSYGRRLLEIGITRSKSTDRRELNYGAPPEDMLPARFWRDAYSRACVVSPGRGRPNPCDALGYRPLREALAAYLARARSVRCHPDQVIIFSGPQDALNSAAALLVDAGDMVAVENPGYPGAREQFQSRGAHLRALPVDVAGIDVRRLAELSDDCKLVHVTPSYHDPTGAVMSLERRLELLAWAKRAGALIIEDAFDSDFSYAGLPPPAVQGLDDSDSVLYVYSFWKTMFPLVTTGALVVPRHLLPLFSRQKLLSEGQYPVAEHIALAEMIESGLYERHIKRARARYAERRRELIQALCGSFRLGVEIPRQSAGLHLAVRFDASFAGEAIMRAAAAAGLPIMSTSSYYMEQPVSGEFLIPFACLPGDVAHEKVARMADWLARTDS